jgi:hypothetical protein
MTNSGPDAAFRSDNMILDFKNVSVKEIQAPEAVIWIDRLVRSHFCFSLSVIYKWLYARSVTSDKILYLLTLIHRLS